jgi:hypothetical protein
VLTEFIFYIAELFIKANNKLLGFVTTFILGLYVMIMCFGGSVTSLLISMVDGNGTIEIATIILFFANLFYGYLRGLGRIRSINKKYCNV